MPKEGSAAWRPENVQRFRVFPIIGRLREIERPNTVRLAMPCPPLFPVQSPPRLVSISPQRPAIGGVLPRPSCFPSGRLWLRRSPTHEERKRETGNLDGLLRPREGV